MKSDPYSLNITPMAMAAMHHYEDRITDPFDYLEDDHKTVASMLEKLEETDTHEVAAREEIFSALYDALTMHAEIEERAVYPILRGFEETHELSLEAVEEHQIVKTLLRELSDMPKGSEVWKAKLIVLKENVMHHVREEEGELFKKGRRELEDSEKEHMCRAMEEVMQVAS